MDLNKKIKVLRINKGITQEKLAAYLNVSSQAVSKWENGTSSPDISLLPNLSAYFGVTIDDLFTLNADAHIERIENMLKNETILSATDERYAKNQLMELLADPEKNADAYRLLAMLSNHRAHTYHAEALQYAKKALIEEPNNKHNHLSLIEASRGISTDWNYSNHIEVTKFYKEFVERHPKNLRGLMHLFNHLVADERVDEATEIIQKIKSIKNDYIIFWLKGRLEKVKGHHDLAFEYFNQMVTKDSNNWITYATRADEYARIANYDEAISDNKKAFDLQEVPRYIDSHECRALIYEIQGKYSQAIEMREESKKILKSDWNISYGNQYEYADKEIMRLKTLSKKNNY